ncbi:MAG: sugar ABC transporter permease [Verrucomicrobiota bacterium]
MRISSVSSIFPWGRFWLAAPFFLCAVAFWAVPLGKGLWMSMQSDSYWGATHFVGLKHYADLLEDSRYWKAFGNTFWLATWVTSLTLGLALVFAAGIRASAKWLRAPLSFALMAPGLCPPAAMGILFLLLFHGRAGLLNQWFVSPLGLEPINWLSDPGFVLPAIILQSVWRWAGFMSFFVARAWDALPRDVLEAGALDGASAWSGFWRIRFPMMRPTVLFCGLYLIVDCVSQFAGSYVLLGGSGGTNDSGLLLVSYSYQKAFQGSGFSSATAVSLSIVPWILGLVALLSFVPKGILKGGNK